MARIGTEPGLTDMLPTSVAHDMGRHGMTHGARADQLRRPRSEPVDFGAEITALRAYSCSLQRTGRPPPGMKLPRRCDCGCKAGSGSQPTAQAVEGRQGGTPGPGGSRYDFEARVGGGGVNNLMRRGDGTGPCVETEGADRVLASADRLVSIDVVGPEFWVSLSLSLSPSLFCARLVQTYGFCDPPGTGRVQLLGLSRTSTTGTTTTTLALTGTLRRACGSPTIVTLRGVSRTPASYCQA
ncbi:hypothetical protein LX36DRAFT_165725 [Colletotrichum falcatum]|nr:hypothetical protein LX36DRAFT_165725 [Colletotrichum falcatum]